ncbi:MAG: hemerythrin domain-containing protein [Myxococcales bacterium]|nr:hemerythrin domain-containing protein [Myxococcales bacterium]
MPDDDFDLEGAHRDAEGTLQWLERASGAELASFPPECIHRVQLALQRHFVEEETKLFPKLVRFAPQEVDRLLEEHDLLLRALTSLRQLAMRGLLTRAAVVEVSSVAINHRWREERLVRRYEKQQARMEGAVAPK